MQSWRNADVYVGVNSIIFVIMLRTYLNMQLQAIIAIASYSCLDGGLHNYYNAN